ncbi:hypothetical protein ACFWM7_03425 [Streptomyces sp. NPDC058375]|uniref:hypothetical protein n=1 Tax=Streptomyces sp. NPDC058375 TaxID=3346467 RepID=UPI0036666B30
MSITTVSFPSGGVERKGALYLPDDALGPGTRRGVRAALRRRQENADPVPGDTAEPGRHRRAGDRTETSMSPTELIPKQTHFGMEGR